ncbi:MAG: WD40/YVTN/BNR-like repeat-containing protein [Bacteroidota bacterium]
MKNILLALVACVLVGRADLLAQGWTSQASGTNVTLYEVLLSTAQVGTAVGETGKILRTTNGGTLWFNQTSGTSTDLFGIDFYDTDSGIAVGNGGTMLRTTNGGTNWNTLPQVTTGNLRGISFSSTLVGTVVGLSGNVLRSTNAGASWIDLRGVSAQLFEVFFVSENIGTVVGSGGTILKTTNGGASWVAQSSGTVQSLLGVCFADVNTGIIVGSGGRILRTTNGGTTWSTQPSGTTRSLTSVTMIDANKAYVVGDSGIILRSTDGGIAWTQQASGTIANLKEISFADALIGTVVGAGGVILRTTTGGEPDVSVSLVSPNGGESLQIGATHQITWTASGFPAVKIELTRNNGTNWETITGSTPAPTQSFVWTVTGPSSSQCRVRVSNSANQTLNDQSNALFSITPQVVTANVSADTGWNLVSVPVTASDYRKTILFPSSSTQAFSYDSANGYVVRDTLKNRIGYWLKFDALETVSLTGFAREQDTIALENGWNIIGSISNPVPVSSLVTIPAGIITTPIYGFHYGYFSTATIEPGKGYWVKADQAGLLILNTTP